jgi:hypothetical protein
LKTRLTSSVLGACSTAFPGEDAIYPSLPAKGVSTSKLALRRSRKPQALQNERGLPVQLAAEMGGRHGLKCFVLHREEYRTSPHQLRSRSHSPRTSYEPAIKTRNATDGAYHTGPKTNTWSIKKMRTETRHGISRFVWIGRHGHHFCSMQASTERSWTAMRFTRRCSSRSDTSLPASWTTTPWAWTSMQEIEKEIQRDGESPLRVAPRKSKDVHEHPFSNTKHSLTHR